MARSENNQNNPYNDVCFLGDKKLGCSGMSAQSTSVCDALLIHRNLSEGQRYARQLLDLDAGLTSMVCKTDVAEAVEQVLKKPFDVAFVHLNPATDPHGQILVDFLLQIPFLPTIVLVDRGNDEIGAMALNFGAMDWVCPDSLSRDTLVRSLRYSFEKSHLREALKGMSLLDPLTGVYNRTGFVAVTHPQLQTARRLQRPVLVFSVQITNLEEINADFGQHEKNNALILAARHLAGNFRASDIVGRTGIDDFSILALDARHMDSDVIAERTRQRFIRCQKSEGWPFPIQIRIGFFEPDLNVESDMNALIERAKLFEV